MPDTDNPVLYVCGCFCCTVLITAVILIAISVATLEATEMGLDYSSVTKSINDQQLYSNGRYFLGVGHSFIMYPKDQQSISFPSEKYGSLTARTMDGLSVDLEVSFQYRLRPNLADVVKLYFEWGKAYDQAYSMLARNVLRDVASRWTAYSFFYNRTDIQTDMQIELTNAIEEVYAVLELLQLLEIKLPKSFESALQETETIRQAIKRNQFDRQDAKVKGENRKKRVQEEARVITNQREAQGNVIMNEKERQVQEFTAETTAEITSFLALKETVGLTSSEMVDYMWLANFDTGKSYAKVHMPKPKSIQCWAQPTGPGCDAGPWNQTHSFSCDAGGSCIIQVGGTQLSQGDRVRLVSSGTKCAQAADASVALGSGTGVENGVQPLAAAAGLDVRAFDLGQVALNQGGSSYKVCYCAYAKDAFGCQASGASFKEAGTLKIPAVGGA